MKEMKEMTFKEFETAVVSWFKKTPSWEERNEEEIEMYGYKWCPDGSGLYWCKEPMKSGVSCGIALQDLLDKEFMVRIGLRIS